MDIKMDVTVGSEVASPPRDEVSKVKVNKCIQTRKSYMRKRLKRKLKLENTGREKSGQCPKESAYYEDVSLAESPKFKTISGGTKVKGRSLSDEPYGHNSREARTLSKIDGNASKSTTASDLLPVVGTLSTVHGAKSLHTIKGSPETPTYSKNHREYSVNDTDAVTKGSTTKPSEQKQSPQAKERIESRPTRKVSFAEETKTHRNATEKVDVEPTVKPKQQIEDDGCHSSTGLFNVSSGSDRRSDGATNEARDETDRNQNEDPRFFQTNQIDSKTDPDNIAANDNQHQVDNRITSDKEVNPITTTTTNRSKVNQESQTLLRFPRRETDRGVLLDALSEPFGSSSDSKRTSAADLGGCSVLNASDGCVVLMSHHTCTLRKSSIKLTCMSEDEWSEGSTPQAGSPSSEVWRDPWGSARDAMVQTDSAMFDVESVCPSECSSMSDFTDIVESSPFRPPQRWEGIESTGLLDDMALGDTEGKADILDWVRGKDDTLRNVIKENAQKEKRGEKLKEVPDMQRDKREKKGHSVTMKHKDMTDNLNTCSTSQADHKTATVPLQTKRHRKSPTKTSPETISKMTEKDDKQIQKEKKGKTGDIHGSKDRHGLSGHTKGRNAPEANTHRKKEKNRDRMRNNDQMADFPTVEQSVTQGDQDLNKDAFRDCSQSRGLDVWGPGSGFPGSKKALSAPNYVSNEHLRQQPQTTQQFDAGQAVSGYHDQTVPIGLIQSHQPRYIMATDIPQSNEVVINRQQSVREPITDSRQCINQSQLGQGYGNRIGPMENQSTVPKRVPFQPQDVPYSQKMHNQFPTPGEVPSQFPFQDVPHPRNQTSFSSQSYNPNQAQNMPRAPMLQPMLGQLQEVPVQYGTAARMQQPRQPEMASYYSQAAGNVGQFGLMQPQQTWVPATPQRYGPGGQQPISQNPGPLQPRERSSYPGVDKRMPLQQSTQGISQHKPSVSHPQLANQQTSDQRRIHPGSIDGSYQNQPRNYGLMNVPAEEQQYRGVPTSLRGEIPREPFRYPSPYGFTTDVMNSPQQYESNTIRSQPESTQPRRHMPSMQQNQPYQDYGRVEFGPQQLDLNVVAGPANEQTAYQGSAYQPVPNSYQGDVPMNFGHQLNTNQGYGKDNTPLHNQSVSNPSLYQEGYLQQQSYGGQQHLPNATNVTPYPTDPSFQSLPHDPMSNQPDRNYSDRDGDGLIQQYLGGTPTENVQVKRSAQSFKNPSQGQPLGNFNLGYQNSGIPMTEPPDIPQGSFVGRGPGMPFMSGQSPSNFQQYPATEQKSRMPITEVANDVASEGLSKSSESEDMDSTASADDSEALRYQSVERMDSESVTGTDESQESNGSRTSDDRSEGVAMGREHNRYSSPDRTDVSSDGDDRSPWKRAQEEESTMYRKRERRSERGEMENGVYGDVFDTRRQVVKNERGDSPGDDLEEIEEPLYGKKKAYEVGSGQQAIPSSYREYIEMEDKNDVDIEILDTQTVAAGPRIRNQNSFNVGSDGTEDLQYGSMMSKEDSPQRRSPSPSQSYNEGGEFVSSLHSTPSNTLANGQSAEYNNVDSQYAREGSYPSNARFQMDEEHFSSDASLDRQTNTTENNETRSAEGKPSYLPLSINIPPLNLGYLRDTPGSPIPVIAVNDDVILPEGYDSAQGTLHDSGFGEERQARISSEPMENIREDEKKGTGGGEQGEHPAGKVHLLKAYLTNTYPDHKALLAMPGLTLPLPEDGLRSPGALSIVSVATVEEGTQTELPFSERWKDIGTQDYQHQSRLDASELEHLQIERARIIEALGRDPYLTSTAELEALLNYSMGETKALLEVMDDPWYTDIMLPLFPGESKETDEKIINTTHEYVDECRKEVLPVIAEYEERRLLAEEKQHRFAAEEDQKRAKKTETFLDRHRDLPDVRRSPGLQRRVYSEFETQGSPSLLRRTYSETDSRRSPGTQRRALYSESEIHRILGTDRNKMHRDSNVLRSPLLQRKLYHEEDVSRSSPSLQRMSYESDINRSHSSQRNLYEDSHIVLNRSSSMDIPIAPIRTSTTTTTFQLDSTISSGRQISPRPDPPLSPCAASPPQYSSLVTNHPTIHRHDLKQAQDVHAPLYPRSKGVPLLPSPRAHAVHPPLSPRTHGFNQPLSPRTQGQLHPPMSPRGSHPSEHKENLLSVRRELVNETILSRSAPSSPRS